MEVEACTGCEMTMNDFCDFSMDSSKLREYLIKHGVVHGSRRCPACGSPLILSEGISVFRCQKRYQTIHPKKKRVSRRCNTSVSLYMDTLLHNCRGSIRRIYIFIASWILKPPDECYVASECDMSKVTIHNWFHCMWNISLHSLSSNINPVGGLEKTVEIYEAKVFHRKCKCGKIVNGNCVFGFLERDSHNCFAVAVETNGPEMLLSIIEKYVMPGTTLVSNCWRNYNCLQSQGYSQLRVNNCLNFVYPGQDTGRGRGITHIWREVQSAYGLSRFRNSEKLLHYHVVEFLFRYRHPVHVDRIHNIFTAIGKSYSKLDALITSAEGKDCSSMNLSE